MSDAERRKLLLKKLQAFYIREGTELFTFLPQQCPSSWHTSSGVPETALLFPSIPLNSCSLRSLIIHHLSLTFERILEFLPNWGLISHQSQNPPFETFFLLWPQSLTVPLKGCFLMTLLIPQYMALGHDVFKGQTDLAWTVPCHCLAWKAPNRVTDFL